MGVPYKDVVALFVASSRDDVTAAVSDERRTTLQDADETPTASNARDRPSISPSGPTTTHGHWVDALAVSVASRSRDSARTSSVVTSATNETSWDDRQSWWSPLAPQIGQCSRQAVGARCLARYSGPELPRLTHQ
jgi:hypothetical protein